MTVTGIDHVQVAAPPGCEAEARAFYGELLGLEELAKPEAPSGEPDSRLSPRISFPYGHEAVAGVLRGGRPQVVLPRGREARRDPAGGLAPGARAREAARHPVARPVRPPRRADGERAQALPVGATAARTRGGDRER